MANKKYLARLKQGVEAWNRWRKANPCITPDLSGTDLTGADLTGADLCEADLRRANLHKANLAGADLYGALLTEANLTRASLRGAILGWTGSRDTWRVNGLWAPLDYQTDLNGANLAETDLAGAILKDVNFHRAILTGADLSAANLVRANLTEVNLRGASLIGANLTEANLARADLFEANLAGANLTRADLRGALLPAGNLHTSDLREANLVRADLTGADLSEANLVGADLTGALLVETNFEGANLTGCSVYGIAAWDVNLIGAQQSDLIITRADEPVITVDDMEVAQFIYLLLHNEKVRQVIDTITSKAVLILGRFTPKRKVVLDAIRDELRRRNYLPILFDFEKPASRDLTETISTLAHMARFIIADLTEAKSIPQELQRIVPDLPSVPVQPLLQVSTEEYGMFEHFKRYPWVLETYHYNTVKEIIASLSEKVITPAEIKANELLGPIRRRHK